MTRPVPIVFTAAGPTDLARFATAVVALHILDGAQGEPLNDHPRRGDRRLTGPVQGSPASRSFHNNHPLESCSPQERGTPSRNTLRVQTEYRDSSSSL